MRHDLGDAETPVEIGAADMHAGAAEDVLRAVGMARPFRRQSRDHEVRRAAAEIDDQGQFLALQILLIGQGRRHRFELGLDVTEALRLGDADQLALGAPVGLVVMIDEAHRTAEHDALDRVAGLVLDQRLQVPHEQADDVAQRHALALDQGGVVDQRRAEHALERAQQPAFGPLDIVPDAVAAEARLVRFVIVEDRAGQGDAVALQLAQRKAVAGGDADRRVGGAEVEPAIAALFGRS